tara:strand:+ start:235 stop:390 length:156 start_codon:yes stop_codon:yes gene_type:complete
VSKYFNPTKSILFTLKFNKEFKKYKFTLKIKAKNLAINCQANNSNRWLEGG